MIFLLLIEKSVQSGCPDNWYKAVIFQAGEENPRIPLASRTFKSFRPARKWAKRWLKKHGVPHALEDNRQWLEEFEI